MHTHTPASVDVTARIAAFKRDMAARRAALARAFAEVRDHVRRAVDRIRADADAGRPVIPEIAWRDIDEGRVSDETLQAVRRTGCAVVRGIFPESVARGWFDELGEYLETNRYAEREAEKRGLDQYFSTLKAGAPQIFNGRSRRCVRGRTSGWRPRVPS